MTFSEGARIRLLEAKRMLGNVRSLVGAISDAISCNWDSWTPELTCVAAKPIRPPVGRRVTIGKFAVVRPLKILDYQILDRHHRQPCNVLAGRHTVPSNARNSSLGNDRARASSRVSCHQRIEVHLIDKERRTGIHPP